MDFDELRKYVDSEEFKEMVAAAGETAAKLREAGAEAEKRAEAEREAAEQIRARLIARMAEISRTPESEEKKEAELEAAEEWDLVKNVDRRRLKECIEYLFVYRTVRWSEAETRTDDAGNTITIFSYPMYPREVLDAVDLMDAEAEYGKITAEIEDRRLQPSDLNARQLQAVLYSLKRQEKFNDGVIAQAVESSLLLRLLMRLDDIITRMKADD